MIESEKDIRWKHRFSDYKKALAQLSEFPPLAKQNKFEMQGFIQSFESTFELAWKTLQDLLKERGYIDARGPRPVIEQCFKDGTIEDGEGWMNMLKDLNRSIYTYQDELASEIASNIAGEYLELFKKLMSRLGDE